MSGGRIGDEEDLSVTDGAWVDRESDRRREIGENERAALEALLRRGREEMPLPARLQAVLSQIAMIQTAPAPRIVREPRSAEARGMGPPAAETIDVEHHLVVIRTRIQDIEHELDLYRGLTTAPQRQNLRGFEKDKLLFGTPDQPSEFVGMHADDVAQAAPYLGSARTIRRLRADRDLDIYGRPRPPKPPPRRR